MSPSQSQVQVSHESKSVTSPSQSQSRFQVSHESKSVTSPSHESSHESKSVTSQVTSPNHSRVQASHARVNCELPNICTHTLASCAQFFQLCAFADVELHAGMHMLMYSGTLALYTLVQFSEKLITQAAACDWTRWLATSSITDTSAGRTCTHNLFQSCMHVPRYSTLQLWMIREIAVPLVHMSMRTPQLDLCHTLKYMWCTWAANSTFAWKFSCNSGPRSVSSWPMALMAAHRTRGWGSLKRAISWSTICVTSRISIRVTQPFDLVTHLHYRQRERYARGRRGLLCYNRGELSC